MNIKRRVNNRIKKYGAKGNLDQTSLLCLNQFNVYHKEVRKHSEGVALLAEDVALQLKQDEKAAFFAGLLHDVGKTVLPHPLFDGHNISSEEYEDVKKHAVAGFEILKDLHLFTAICAGLHHKMYRAGYGLVIKDFPKEWNLATIKKVLEISMIVSICDFINAYCNRNTKIKDGSDENTKSLKEMLFEKYPEDKEIVEIAFEENKKYIN